MSAAKYVSLKTIAQHAGKTVPGVRKALKAAGVELKMQKGVKGVRIPLKTANELVHLNWEKGPIHLPQ